MPKGPRGEKRPGDVIGAAIMVARTAMGEIEDNATAPDKANHSRGGKKGRVARAKSLSSSERSGIARRAALSRWQKRPGSVS
jgi:hypothetical protein